MAHPEQFQFVSGAGEFLPDYFFGNNGALLSGQTPRGADADLDRRGLLTAGVSGLLCAPGALAAGIPQHVEGDLGSLEREAGGRIGVAALNTATGLWLRHRADERFALCSSFKALLAAVVLRAIDEGVMSGAGMIPYTEADLVAYSPRTKAGLAAGEMSVFDLCAAAVEVSDNTAANLLLRRIGGPAGFTASLRAMGDPTTRLDRYETDLNSNLPGDPRDTTTPAAFVRILGRVLLGPALSDDARKRLTGWMIACETGRERLRAGLPKGWAAGDKTGTGERGAVNDVAIAWPPGRPPILIAVLMSGSGRPTPELSAAHARIARVVAAALA